MNETTNNNEAVSITTEGALVRRILSKTSKSEVSKFILIKSDTLEEIGIEHILDEAMNFGEIGKLENKIVKVTGRLWHGKILADVIEEVK